MQDTEDSVLINDQKPEGRALGSRQGPCREAGEGPARFAPGKILPFLPPLQRSDQPVTLGLSSWVRVMALTVGELKRC